MVKITDSILESVDDVTTEWPHRYQAGIITVPTATALPEHQDTPLSPLPPRATLPQQTD